MSGKNQEFVIKFEGANLSKAAADRIQHGIDELLMQELGGTSGAISADGDDNYCGIYIPRKWIGRQILVANLARLQELSKEQTLGAALRVQNAAQ